jgi:hypothetical protein
MTSQGRIIQTDNYEHVPDIRYNSLLCIMDNKTNFKNVNSVWGRGFISNRAKTKIQLLKLWWGLETGSCTEYFRKLKILPLQSQYIYLLLLFVTNNIQHFKINSDIHNINTMNNLDLHYPLSYLSVYHKGAHYTGIKVFNRLPVPIK